MSRWRPKVPLGQYKAEQRPSGGKRKRMTDEGTANKADVKPMETITTQTCLVIIDSLLAELE